VLFNCQEFSLRLENPYFYCNKAKDGLKKTIYENQDRRYQWENRQAYSDGEGKYCGLIYRNQKHGKRSFPVNTLMAISEARA
jgi:hypothetical protein